MIQAVIFDLDGVITNTVPHHFASWKQLFQKEGRDLTWEDYKNKLDGLPRMTGIKNVLGEQLSQSKLDALMAAKQIFFLEQIKKNPPQAFPGFELLLEALKKYGMKISVASSSKNCLVILQSLDLDKEFSAIVSGDNFKQPKPHPDIFLTAAQRLDIDPKQCLVFEDAPVGIQAAVAAGMIAIGFASGHEPKQLIKAGAKKVFRDYAGVNVEDIISI